MSQIFNQLKIFLANHGNEGAIQLHLLFKTILFNTSVIRDSNAGALGTVRVKEMGG